MKEIWQRIEKWLEANHPEGLTQLNPAATNDLIEQTEKLLETKLPEDVREFYRIHNGASWELGLIEGGELLSLEEIERNWQVWKELLDAGEFDDDESEPEAGIKGDWWNAKWIPITHDGGGNHLCLDLDPAPEGNYGQMIAMWHDASERELIANSFREWLETFVNELEAGEYVYSEEYGVFRADEI